MGQNPVVVRPNLGELRVGAKGCRSEEVIFFFFKKKGNAVVGIVENPPKSSDLITGCPHFEAGETN